MQSASIPTSKPRWYFIPVRALLITFMLTLLSFAVSLLLGILAVVIGAGLRGVHPNLAFAYKHVAFPVAVTAAAIVLVSSLVMEIRHYRRQRVLDDMEQQMGRAS